jgi:hypothetical protein
MTYTVAGVTVVTKYEEQSATPWRVGKALAWMAEQVSTLFVQPDEESPIPRRQLSALQAVDAVAFIVAVVEAVSQIYIVVAAITRMLLAAEAMSRERMCLNIMIAAGIVKRVTGDDG